MNVDGTEYAALLDEYIEAKDQRDQWARVAEEHRKVLVEYSRSTGDFKFLAGGAPKAEVKEVISRRFRKADFARDYPKLAKEYSTESVSYRLETGSSEEQEEGE